MGVLSPLSIGRYYIVVMTPLNAVGYVEHMWDFGGAKLISKIFLEENAQKKKKNKNIAVICTSIASKGGCI